MDTFFLLFFVKIDLVESFHKGINGSIGVFSASNEKLSLSDTSFFDGRVVLNISYWKICVKNFIKPFFPQTYSNTILFFLFLKTEVNFFYPFFSIFCANNGDLNDFSDVFIEDFDERFIDFLFRLIRKFIEDVTCTFFCRWRYNIDNKIEELLNFSKERTFLINFDNPIALSLLQMLILIGCIAHQFMVKITMIKSINTCRHY